MSSDEKEPKVVSRRFFIKGAAASAAVAGVAAAAGCTPTPAPQAGPTPTPVVKEVIKEVIKEVPVAGSGVLEPSKEPETSVIRGSSFSGFGRDGAPTRVEVKNGKIVRIRPLRYAQEGFGPDVLKPWKIEV